MTAAANNKEAPQPTIAGRLAAQLAEHSSLAALSIDEIDACILEYESAQRLLAAAKETHDGVKDVLIALVKTHGSAPAGAEESKRIVGRRNVATITFGKVTTINDDAVLDLLTYLTKEELLEIFNKLFSAETKYKLIDGARDVLRHIKLPNRVHDKILSLFGRTFDVRSKSPSLKISAIVPEKPAKKARAGKVAA